MAVRLSFANLCAGHLHGLPIYCLPNSRIAFITNRAGLDLYHGHPTNWLYFAQFSEFENAAENIYFVSGWYKGQFTLNDICPDIEGIESETFGNTTDLRMCPIDPVSEES